MRIRYPMNEAAITRWGDLPKTRSTITLVTSRYQPTTTQGSILISREPPCLEERRRRRQSCRSNIIPPSPKCAMEPLSIMLEADEFSLVSFAHGC